MRWAYREIPLLIVDLINLLAYQYLIKRSQDVQQIQSTKDKLQYLTVLERMLLRFTLH